MLHQITGDYLSAGTSNREALEIFRGVGDQPNQAVALNDLGVVQQLTGDYLAAAAAHQQAIAEVLAVDAGIHAPAGREIRPLDPSRGKSTSP